MRVLTIDIGNTNIGCAIFENNRIKDRYYIPTREYTIRGLKRYLGKVSFDHSIICSVVPQLNSTLRKDLLRLSGESPYVLGETIKVPIRNLYRRPEQVGQDRLVNAYAGIVFFGAPLIIVDFGTALTFDLVSKNKDYLGGLILPGLKISLEALAKRAALLPKVKLTRPKELIGADTKSSILSGIVYGFASSIECLVNRLKKEIGRGAKVIGTGGDIDFMSKYCKRFDKIDKDLTLKGLNLIYKKVTEY